MPSTACALVARLLPIPPASDNTNSNRFHFLYFLAVRLGAFLVERPTPYIQPGALLGLTFLLFLAVRLGRI